MFSCVAALLLSVSELSDWVNCLDHQRGFLSLNNLEIVAIEITTPLCMVVFGGWWADSAFMHERFLRSMRSIRPVK